MMDTNKFDFSQRNYAIDILRALTVWLMIFVNDFWSVSDVPQWMKHAARDVDYLGLADVVFPVFLFAVGMSIPFAIENRFRKGFSELSTVGHILSRSFALLIMGAFTVTSEGSISQDIGMTMHDFKVIMVIAFFMVWNVYPKTDKPIRHLYTVLQVVGVLILIFIAFIFRNKDGGYIQARWWGILGIIGWTYLVCAFIYLFVRNINQSVSKNKFTSVIPVVFYFWLGFLIFSMCKSSQLIPKEPNLINDFTRLLRIDGENVLTMGGVLFSLVIAKYSHVTVRKKIIFIVSTVVVLLIIARISNEFWIISKNRCTPPWLLYCTAITIGTYGLLHWIVSMGGAKWFNIIKAGGTATLSCYVMPYFLQSIFYGYLSFIVLPDWAKTGIPGLIKCALWALLCILITALLERFKVKLKI